MLWKHNRTHKAQSLHKLVRARVGEFTTAFAKSAFIQIAEFECSEAHSQSARLQFQKVPRVQFRPGAH